jgi:hypothetical protein
MNQNKSLEEEYEDLFGQFDVKTMLIDLIKEQNYQVGHVFTISQIKEIIKTFLYCEYNHVVHECQIKVGDLGEIVCILKIDESQHVAEVLRGNRVDKQLVSFFKNKAPIGVDLKVILQPSPFKKRPNNITINLT